MTRSTAILLMVSLLAAAPLRAADEAPPPTAVEEAVEGAVDEEPAGDVVRYENGRLTVRARNAPLDRLLGQIAAATGATIRGGMPSRTGSYDFADRPLSDALSRMLGSESFMLTYGADGSLRAIRLLGRGEAVTVASPAPAAVPGAPAPGQAPLAQEEQQAGVLQKQVIVTDHPPLRRALGTTLPPIGRVLHATTLEANPNVRSAAREVALKEFAEDPAVEAAYLSTLEPVDDATLARMLTTSGAPGAAQEWMQALATRAPSPALRAKAKSVLTALGH